MNEQEKQKQEETKGWFEKIKKTIIPCFLEDIEEE